MGRVIKRAQREMSPKREHYEKESKRMQRNAVRCYKTNVRSLLLRVQRDAAMTMK
jgi:hypothetical protein